MASDNTRRYSNNEYDTLLFQKNCTKIFNRLLFLAYGRNNKYWCNLSNNKYSE